MDFSNATLLASTWKNDFLGDTLRFNSTQTLNIEGFVLNLRNSDGVSGILTGVAALESGARNWDAITINGYTFGSGIVESFTFSEGRDVQTKTYNATIQIPRSGDFSSLTGLSTYSGLSYSNLQYLHGFTESSSLDRNIQRETYSQNIKFNIKAPYNLSGVAVAKTVAQNFFQNNYLNSFIGTLYSGTAIKNFYTESYDSINNNFDFARTFEISTAENPSYSLWRSTSLDFDLAGISKVTEKAEYLGHTTNPFTTVSAQAYQDIGNAYSRCNSFFSAYKQNGEASLLSQPIIKSITTNPFAATLNYTVVFSNAFNIQSNGFWDYTIDITQTQGGVYLAEEKGIIIGFGHIIFEKYNNAVNLWGTVQGGVASRLATSSYYNSHPGGYNPPSIAIKLAASSTILDQVEGKIDYTFKYSNQDSILATTNIKKATVHISQESNRHLATSFNISNYKEIVQVQPNLLPNVLSYDIKLNGQAATDINTYLTTAKTYLPAGTSNSKFLTSVDYNYNQFERSFGLNATITTLPSS